MPRNYNNYAFIDGVNLHLTYENLDWKVDYGKLLDLLRAKYEVDVAYYFLGNTTNNKTVRDNLDSFGYTLKLKDPSPYTEKAIICEKCHYVIKPEQNRNKADVDSLLTMQIMADMNTFNKAIVITSDGDFDEIVKRLLRLDKLKVVISPSRDGCSKLLKKVAVDKIAFIEDFREAVEKE